MSEGESPPVNIGSQTHESSPATPEAQRSPRRTKMIVAGVLAAGALLGACDTNPDGIYNTEAASADLAEALTPFAGKISQLKPGEVPGSETTYTSAGVTNDLLKQPLGTKTVTVGKDNFHCSFTITGVLPVNRQDATIEDQNPVAGWEAGNVAWPTTRGVGAEMRDAQTGQIVQSVNADIANGKLTIETDDKRATYSSDPNVGEQQLTDEVIEQARSTVNSTYDSCTNGQG